MNIADCRLCLVVTKYNPYLRNHTLVIASEARLPSVATSSIPGEFLLHHVGPWILGFTLNWSNTLIEETNPHSTDLSGDWHS